MFESVTMGSSFARRTGCLSLVAVLVVLIGSPAGGQTARVQFINASTYEAADTIDVYLDGVLLLDDLLRKTGTPFRDYPAAVPLNLEVKRAGAVDDTEVFYSETVTFEPGERYFAIAAGDPANRIGQPPFKIFFRAGAPEGSELPGYTQMVVFNNDPAGAVTNIVRGIGEQSDLAKFYGYGEFSDMLYAGKMAWDVDCFQAETDSVLHIAPDFTDFGRRSAALIGFCRLIVLSDGTTYTPAENVAHLQFAHIASYPGSYAVDVLIDGRVVANNVPAGSATAFFDVPSGLREETAPDIKIEVRASGRRDDEPLYTLEEKFLFGHRYVSVLAGNRRDADATNPVALYVTEVGVDSTLQQADGLVTVFNGIGGTRSITLGSGTPSIVPFTERIPFGAFESGVPLPRVDTTVVIMDGDDRSLLASFELNLVETGLADSSIVLLASDTIPTVARRRTSTNDVALVAVLPSGGALVSFEGSSPLPWWQKPWSLFVLLAGVAAIAFVGSQVRVRRLEARSRELERTVEERTRELRAEKEKTEEQARRLVELDEAKNRFFANISHEFRTPLTLILGPLQDALDGLYQDDPGGLAKQHRLMHRSARRLLRLINQLLDLSRLESGKMALQPEPGDLVNFVRGIYRSFVPLAERRRIALD
ncbi:MAG: hypothetical protein KJO44_02190, partial [Gemmatimonadetes bacterium]|nr:hypothetical protein [Gemmatimonadota bacterium]